MNGTIQDAVLIFFFFLIKYGCFIMLVFESRVQDSSRFTPLVIGVGGGRGVACFPSQFAHSYACMYAS